MKCFSEERDNLERQIEVLQWVEHTQNYMKLLPMTLQHS